MTMFGEYELRDVALTLESQRRMVETFLHENGLRLDPLDVFVGIFDSEDKMVGGGGLKGNVIKCVAIDARLRSELLANTLVGRLRELAFSKGHENILVFTKPENETVFKSLAFHTVGRSRHAIVLESDPRGILDFTKGLQSLRKEGRNGAIVMHCNPLTYGHYALIRYASTQVSNLYVILVSEDGATFSTQERREMLSAAIRDISNATVIDGGQYVISAATFPSYFIKDESKAADAQIDLDLDIFQRHIIPALNLSVRFVGTEPSDELTRRYNERMKAALNIEVVEMPRIRINDTIVSASLVRRLIAEGKAAETFAFVPISTIPYIISHAAATALHSELELTPKPGLVDKHDNGAHKDMDFDLMERSIRALQPFFTELAQLGEKPERPSTDDIRTIGIRAEKAMLETTRGVNTHRGALFSMGLAVVAAAICLRRSGEVNADELKDEIARIAAGFPQANGTHGSDVRKKYNINGAVAMAQGGYAQLFDSWLPFLRTSKHDEDGKMKLLLLIMCQIDDTNIYFRCEKDTAIKVKRLSLQVLNDFSLQSMRSMNQLFISRNISPGGAADMLALTLFIDSICCKRNGKNITNTNNIKANSL